MLILALQALKENSRLSHSELNYLKSCRIKPIRPLSRLGAKDPFQLGDFCFRSSSPLVALVEDVSIGLHVASPKACVAWRFWLGEQSNKGGRGQRLREEIDKTAQLHGYRPQKNLYTHASEPLGSPSLHFASNRIFRDFTELCTVPAQYQALLLHLPTANFKMAAKSQRIDKVSNLYSIVII